MQHAWEGQKVVGVRVVVEVLFSVNFVNYMFRLMSGVSWIM